MGYIMYDLNCLYRASKSMLISFVFSLSEMLSLAYSCAGAIPSTRSLYLIPIRILLLQPCHYTIYIYLPQPFPYTSYRRRYLSINLCP